MRALLTGLVGAWLIAASHIALADPVPPADALVAAGFEHLRNNDADAAEQSFREALKADRQARGAYFGRAMVAAAKDNFPRASDYFEREIKNTPDVGEAYNNAGVMQAQRRNLVAALVHFTAAANRLGAVEALFNNFGRCLDEYFFEQKLGTTLPKEVIEAAEVFERLEQQISLNPPQPGLVRFGSKWITTEERDRIARQNEQLDAQIAAEQQTIEQLMIDVRTTQGEIDALYSQLIRLRNHWDLYPDWRTHHKWNQIVAIETDIERLSGRLAGLQDSIAVADANIQRLAGKKIRASWFTEFELFEWPGAPDRPAPAEGPVTPANP